MRITSPVIRLVLLGALVIGGAAGLASGQEGSLHAELKFALRLDEMGYSHLAVDHLIRTRERTFLPREVRLQATKMLAQVYGGLGEQAGANRAFEEKHDYLQKAITQYGRYLDDAADRIGEEERSEILVERGALSAGLGRDAFASMEGTADEQERKDYKRDAIEWFGKSVADLEVSGQYLANLRDALYEAAETKEEKIRLWQIREKAGEALMEWGRALYDFSRVYTEEEEAPKRDENLKTAIGIFEGVAEHYGLFDLRYKAFRYIGLCYRGMGEYAKAVESLKKATELLPISDTIWILRLARYNLAQTYNDWGQYERGDVAAAALISDVYPEMVARQDEDADLIDVYFAAWLERGRALTGHAKELMEKAEEAERNNQAVLAQERRRQAQREYRIAVDKAKEISAYPNSRWARNAKMLLDRWIEESEVVYGEGKRIPLPPDINTFMSEGWRLFKEGKYLECVPAFQQAMLEGDPAVYGRTLIPEAWYQVGISYYNLSMPEHTGGKYNYYHEAALCFTQLVERYSKAAFAADAAYYAQQLYGALFEQTREMVRRGQRERESLTFDGRRYYRALERFSVEFSSDPRARGTLFQSAELARTLEQYEEASAMYARIMQEHPRYYEAKYRAGLCLYLQALKLFDEEGAPAFGEVGSLLDTATGRYQDYIDWFVNNRDRLGAEQFEEVNKWVLQTKVAYGKLLVHDAWTKTRETAAGARRSLEVLADVEEEHFGRGVSEELRAQDLPDAFFVIIQAHRRLDQLSKAEGFVDDLVKRFGEHELSSRAARFLGYAYLQKRKDLEEQDGSEEEVKLAARNAGKYLETALQLDPEQSLGVYNDTAGQLYVMGEYPQAIRILLAGIGRFPIQDDRMPTQSQLTALAGLEGAYLQLEDWPKVALHAGQLLAIEKRRNEERLQKGEPPVRNVDYWRDYALAMERQHKFDEAIQHWREVKAVSDRMEDEQGKETKFTATFHLARSYAAKGEVDHGYRVIAWYLLSTPDWLRNKQWAESVDGLYQEFFRGKYADLREYVVQLVTADITLLRQQESKEVILGLFDRRWPNRKGELNALLEKARVTLGTGE